MLSLGLFSSAVELTPMRMVLAIVVAPVVLPVVLVVMLLFGLLFVLVSPYFMIAQLVAEQRLKRRMISAGRYLSPREYHRIGEQGGTIIIECFTLGWGLARLWWTPENLSEQQQSLAETPEAKVLAMQERTGTAWDRWCWEHLLSPDTGHAYLFKTWSWPRTWSVSRIQRRYPGTMPGTMTVGTWSGSIFFEKDGSLPMLPESASEAATSGSN